MKRSMRSVCGWVLGGVAVVVLQTGCAVGPGSWTEGKQSQHMVQFSENVADHSKTGKFLSGTVRVDDPGVARVWSLQTDNQVQKDPNPLHPKGLWKGTLNLLTGEKYGITLKIDVKKAAFLRKKRAVQDAGWSFIRSARACGPYGEITIQPLLAEFHVDTSSTGSGQALQQANLVSLQGEVESMDAFRYSSNLRLEATENLQISAYVGQDPKTKVLQLYGSVFRKSQKGEFQVWGRFVLTR